MTDGQMVMQMGKLKEMGLVSMKGGLKAMRMGYLMEMSWALLMDGRMVMGYLTEKSWALLMDCQKETMMDMMMVYLRDC